MKNFKKVISAVVALAMSISSFAAVNASSFTDVADTAAYAEAIDVLTALGIVNGYVDDTTGEVTFNPEGEITRAEAATMIVRALNMEEDAKASSGSTQFEDVNTQAAWAAGYVNVGVSQGYINGMGDNTFAPQENVTYAQMCKMLTSIAGFGEYAAANTSNQNDWSAGYTSMAASTGINKGVSVSKDTALTRGQVAMMVYNTLLTPKLGVAEYALTGNTYSQLDGRNGRDFVTLLSEKFDGYLVTAQITDTPTASSTGLENDEVQINVQKADWWNDQIVTAPLVTTTGAIYNEIVNFTDDVEVNSNLLQVGKAVIVYDELDDPWMIYFAANSKTETKEFNAVDYVDQSRLGSANRFESINKIRIGSKYYTMNTNSSSQPDVDLYVNGAKLKDITGAPTTAGDWNDLLDQYLGEAQGTIKLVKQATDNGYSSIFIDAYEIAEVTNVTYKNNQTTVSFTRKTNLFTTNVNRIVINDDEIEDGDKKVTVMNGDAEIALKDLQKEDIIAIACDFNATAIGARDVAAKDIKVLVSRESVNGQLTGQSTEDSTYTIGDKTYTVVGSYPTWNLRDTYTVRLDPFGRIYDAEQDASATAYAIVEKWNQDAETVQLVLADGTTKSYELESGVQTTVLSTLWSNYPTNTVKAAPWDRVVEYTVKNSTGTISAMTNVAAAVNPLTAPAVEFKGSTNKLGSASIQATTNIISAVDYVDASKVLVAGVWDGTSYAYTQGKAADYATVSVDTLKDGTTYGAVSFKPTNATYASFVILTKIGNVYTEDSRFAVLKKAAQQQTTSDGDIAWAAEVMYDGDITTIMFENNPNTTLAVGDAFFFEKNSEDLVDDYYVIYDHSDMQLKGHNAATVTNPATLYTAFQNFTTAGVPSDKYDSTTIKGWKFDMYDNGTAVQLFPAVISNINGNSVELARIDTTTTPNEINRNDGVTADGDAGVETFGIDPDAHIYINDINDATQVLASDRIYAGSLMASVLDPFEISAPSDRFQVGTANTAGDLADNILSFAIVMVVDGDIVCAYNIVQ